MSRMRYEKRAPILITLHFLKYLMPFLPADPPKAGAVSLGFIHPSPWAASLRLGFPAPHCHGLQSEAPGLFCCKDANSALGVGQVRNIENGEAGQVSAATTRGLEIVALPCWLLGASGTSTVRLKLRPFPFLIPQIPGTQIPIRHSNRNCIATFTPRRRF